MLTKFETKISLHPKFDKLRRISAFSALEMESGKNLTLILAIFFHLSNCLSPSSLKGGLVYSEEYEQGPIYLNPQTYTITRILDTSILTKFIQFTTAFTNLFENQCSKTDISYEQVLKEISANKYTVDYNKKHKTYFYVNWNLELYQSEFACKAHDGVLPEIRSVNDREEIRKMAIEANITQVAAGIKYDTGTGKFRYMSDYKNVMLETPFKSIEYGGSYGESKFTGHFSNDPAIRSFAPEYMVMYKDPQNNFIMRIANGDEQNKIFNKFLCMDSAKRKPTLNTAIQSEASMLAMVKHNCKRDKTALIAAARAATANAAAIANLEIDPTAVSSEDLSLYLPNFDPLLETTERRKRASQSQFSDEEFQNSVATIVDRIDDKLLVHTKLKEEEEIFVAKLGYDVIQPKVPFRQWIIQLLTSIKNSDLNEKTGFKPTTSDKQVIKCLKSKKCSNRKQLKENSFAKRQILRNVKKSLTQVLLKELMSNKIPNEMEKRIVKREIALSSSILAMMIYGGPVSPVYPVYDLFNMTGTHQMNKRAIPLIPILGTLAAATVGANVGSSIINGGAPLSWFGKPLGKLLGFANTDEVNAIIDQLSVHATAIDTLHFNDMETRATVNEIISSKKKFEEKIAKTFKAASAVMLEADLRSYLRYLIALLESSSNKYVLVTLSASTGKASPLAITQKEITIIADRILKEKGIKLSTDISQIKMSMIKNGAQIQLVFDIPILIEQNLYHFYKVDAIPLFENGTTYIPELDAPFLGISKTGSAYVTLSSDEFTRCTTDPSLCTVSSPTNPMTSKAHCTVTTYITGNMTCTLIESEKPPVRFIHIKGNHTIFSVPEKTMVYIKCNDAKNKFQSHQTTFLMENMGQVTFRPGCTVNFPDGTTFQTPEIHLPEQIDESKIFQVIDTYSIPRDARIRRFIDYSKREIATLATEYRFPTFGELKENIFHPTKALGFLVQFMMAITIVIIITISCLCYWRPIRVCLGNTRIMFCFRKIQPEEVIDPLRREKLKSILKSGLSKAKSTSDLVLDNLKSRRSQLRRTKSAVTFAEDGSYRMRRDYSTDEEMDNIDLVTVPRDRVTMVYKKTPNEDEETSHFLSFSNKKFESN